MVSKIQVESWILMHACKHKYHQVVKGILNRHHDNLDELDVPKIYLSIAMIYNVVTTDNVSYYPVVVNHLDFIYGEVPDAVPFKLYSKLSIGLKMKWAMELLKNSHDDTLMVLNNYFPRKGSHYKHAIQKELSCLHSVQKNFRKFFLPLLAHQNQREAYFQDEFEEEYGKRFQGALQQLAGTFVEKLTSLLPPTAIEKILTEGPERYHPLLESSTHLSLEMLLDTVHGKEVLEENDLLDLLTMVSPLHTKDRVQVDKVWLLCSNESNMSSSKSLFSSNSDDQPTGLQHDTCEGTLDSSKAVDLTDSSQNAITGRTSEGESDTVSNNIRQLSESFGDFIDKRHLFQCNMKNSQSKQISKKDSEHKMNSDNVESPKSSGESVSILSKRHIQTRTKTRDDRLLEGARLVEPPPDVRQVEPLPEVLPEQVHTVSSSSPDNSDRQVAQDCDSNTQKLAEENCHIQTDSLNGNGTERITEGDEEDLALEPWLSFEDSLTGLIGYRSESDIDLISEDEDDVIPPSRTEDIEFWDIFSCDENNLISTEPLAVPAIGAHAKHPDMRLCVVKLFRNETLDVLCRPTGIKYDVFS